MTAQDLSQKVLKTIKTKKLKPKPKWTFQLREYFIWFASIALVIIGSLAFSVIVFLVRHNDWDIYEQLNDSFFKFVLLTLPYVWLILLIGFIFLAHYLFRHTKRGYRYTLYTIILSCVFISIVLGTVLYFTGVGRRIDWALCEHLPLPFYGKIFNRRMEIWSQTQKGRLGGTILSIEEAESSFQLKALDGRIWKILCKEALIIPGPEIILKGERVRVMGKKGEDDIFQAYLVIPFAPKEKFLENRERIKRHLKENPEILKQLKGKLELRHRIRNRQKN